MPLTRELASKLGSLRTLLPFTLVAVNVPSSSIKSPFESILINGLSGFLFQVYNVLDVDMRIRNRMVEHDAHCSPYENVEPFGTK